VAGRTGPEPGRGDRSAWLRGLQYHHSYLQQRTDLPGGRSQDGNQARPSRDASPYPDTGGPRTLAWLRQALLSGDLLSYLRAEPGLALVVYSPLLAGRYVHQDKPLGVEVDHPGTPVRLAALREVAKEARATVNQVVLAWLIAGEVPVIPVVGASSVAQLDESLAAVDLELTAEQRARLDAAG
jgi:Aldo/keto reductase family